MLTYALNLKDRSRRAQLCRYGSIAFLASFLLAGLSLYLFIMEPHRSLYAAFNALLVPMTLREGIKAVLQLRSLESLPKEV